MPRSTRPLKMKEAIQLILQNSASVTPGGKHLKVTHPLHERVFTLTRGGSNKRPTLSQGMSSELVKYLRQCKELAAV